MIKSESVKIVQIGVDAKTVFGLGDDQKMYQWNFLDSTWHLHAVQRERDEVPGEKPAEGSAPAPAPETPPAA